MNPIFVGGTGRSGTTILKRVFASHPAVASIPTELRVIIDPGGALDLKSALTSGWSPYAADAAINRFRRLMHDCASSNVLIKAEPKILRKLGITPRRYGMMDLGRNFGMRYYLQRLDQLIDEISFHKSHGFWAGSQPYQKPALIYETNLADRGMISCILRKYFDDLFKQAAEDENRTHWIDDTPYNLVHVSELLDLFPSMRFIHIYRDTRDVVTSHLRMHWGGDDPTVVAIRVSNILGRWFEIRSSIPESVFVEVALEEMAEDPHATIDRLCDFVGIRFTDEIAKKAEGIDLKKVHAGRWKKELGNSQLKTVLPIIAPYLTAYGYTH